MPSNRNEALMVLSPSSAPSALASLITPPRIALSDWIEANIKMPECVLALPDAVRLWPYQREIADAISDPEIERVTLVKPVRIGFTTLLTGAIASFVGNEPCPILVLLPTEPDARDYMVSDIEPIFGALSSRVTPFDLVKITDGHEFAQLG
jgi:phage terminase large subunit GpA-like protein